MASHATLEGSDASMGSISKKIDVPSFLGGRSLKGPQATANTATIAATTRAARPGSPKVMVTRCYPRNRRYFLDMSAGSTITARIQSALAEGKLRPDIVADLVASGLSKPTAERMVQRVAEGGALTASPSAPLPRPSLPPRVAAMGAANARPSPADTLTGAQREARQGLIAGAFWFSFGIVVTGVTYLAASPGGRFVFAYGAILAGGAAFTKAFFRFLSSGGSFPWLATMAAAAAPLAPFVILVMVATHQRGSARFARRAEEYKRLEAAWAVRVRADAKRRAETDAVARSAEKAAEIARTREGLRTARQPTLVCDLALALGRGHVSEAAPDLMAVLNQPTRSDSERNCAAYALVQLGETAAPLAFYQECARKGTSDAIGMAAAGFADIGPSAAELALPLLRELMKSPHRDRRSWAVESLAKIGPAGRPLLELASRDPDAFVRESAQRYLGQKP